MRGFTRARGARETSKAAHRPQNGAWLAAAAELPRGDENGRDQRTDPPHLHQAKGSLITATSVTIFRSSACSRKSLRASLHRKLKIEDWLEERDEFELPVPISKQPDDNIVSGSATPRMS